MSRKKVEATEMWAYVQKCCGKFSPRTSTSSILFT